MMLNSTDGEPTQAGSLAGGTATAEARVAAPDRPRAPAARRGGYPAILARVARLPFRDEAGGGRRPAKSLTRFWYQFLSFMDRRVSMVFMNYGYAPTDPGDGLTLRPEDEKDRYCAQLYHRVADAADLRGKDVLEVGSGRGGGASFVARYLRPRSTTGVDFAGNAVAFCNRHHPLPGLRFVRGDAASLPFADASFDAILNVESSHCYPSVDGFLREASRVLRPGGVLLFADMRHRAGMDDLRDQFRRAGLVVREEEEITANVLLALRLDNERKLGLIRRDVPRLIRPLFRCFAGMEGTPSHDAFRDGEWVYWRFVLGREGDDEASPRRPRRA